MEPPTSVGPTTREPSAASALSSAYQAPFLHGSFAPNHAELGEYGTMAEGSEGAAAISARALPWDTEVLGERCARVDLLWAESAESIPLLSRLFDRALAAMDRDGIGLVDLRVGLHAYPFVRVAEDRGFRLVDVLNIYLSTSAPPVTPAAPEEIAFLSAQTLTARQLRETRELCRFGHSRLYQDPRIPTAKADAFYERLFDTFAADEASLKCLAADSSGHVVGFFLGREEPEQRESRIGYLWMLATDPRWSGRGLGRSLLGRFLHSMHLRCSVVEIGTQVQNASANRLYQQAGLPVVANVATLHRWNPDLS